MRQKSKKSLKKELAWALKEKSDFMLLFNRIINSIKKEIKDAQ